MPAAARAHRIEVLKKVFTSPFYIFLAAVVAVAYYELFYYVIFASNKQFFFVTSPLYLMYALILSAAVLLTLSVYAVSRSIRAKYAGAEGSLLSILTTSTASLIVGCTCYAPIIASVMYAVGFGTLEVGGVISFLSNYQSWFVVAFIAANLIFIYYQLGRITSIGGVAPKR